jgi:uncharacterized protein (DUF1697 family)
MKQVALLRGINIGSHNRIAMPALRESLAKAGLGEAATYLQSGNVVLDSKQQPEQLASSCEALIAADFGLQIAVVVRTQAELAAVVKSDPLGDVAEQPKLYQVCFCSEQPGAELLDKLSALAAGQERLLADGRELYAWYPDGIARSKLAAQMAKLGKGLVATARNWTTVTKLLELAS